MNSTYEYVPTTSFNIDTTTPTASFIEPLTVVKTRTTGGVGRNPQSAMSRAREMYNTKTLGRAAMVRLFIKELGISENTARMYYQKLYSGQ
jgi:hypothetical protein